MTRDELLLRLAELKKRLGRLRRQVRDHPAPQIARKAIREEAAGLSQIWIDELSPSVQGCQVPREVVAEYDESFTQLLRISRPNNLKSRYYAVLSDLLRRYDDRLVLPVQHSATAANVPSPFDDVLTHLTDETLSEYITEAIGCTRAGYFRAAIVMAWCAAVDRMQAKVLDIGIAKLNSASSAMKRQDKGRFKRFTKEFNYSTRSELQEVFDTDLIHVLEYLGFFDSNQADRLLRCFEMRCHAGHPGDAPTKEANLLSFLSDIIDIIFENPKMQMS